MIGATWRPVVGYPDYLVSDRGSVRSVFENHNLKAHTNHGGYRCVHLKLNSVNGPSRVQRRIHVLVLEAFRGSRPSPRHVGAHGPDRSKKNNRLENLRWALPEENEADKRAHGTQPKGRITKRRTSPATVATIRARAADGDSFSQIARDLHLHRTSVERIVHKKRRAAA